MRITEAERKINWNNTPKRIFNLIRALRSPYPNSYCFYNLKKIYFNKARKFESKMNNKFRNGEIAVIKKEGLVIKCRGGFILASELRDDENRIIKLNKTFLAKNKFV